MRTINSSVFLAIGAAALMLGACGKKEEKKAEPPEAAKPEVAEPAEPAEPAKTPEPAAGADYIKVHASHTPTTEADPVEIAIEKFVVKSASFDPANLEGATAELELDLSSIKSDSGKRDMHLQSPDYLDVAKFGTATVKIADVKKAGDKDYTANAEISAHGVTKTLPVKFTVLETGADMVKIQAEQPFDRTVFGIGKEPDGENEKTSKEVIMKMQLTLKKS